MLRVISCVVTDHDQRLVLLAVFVCGLGALAAVSLLAQVREAERRARSAWLAATAVLTGSAIWATHFIAMLAYSPGGPKGYAFLPTVGSLLLAILPTSAALHLAVAERVPHARPLGGTLVGLSVAAMHYAGMSAFRVAGTFDHDPWLVGASILLAAAFGAGALSLGLRGRKRINLLGGALLLALAICSLHFTGMAAVTIHPDPRIPAPATIISPSRLAVLVAVIGSGILLLSLLALALHRRDRRRALAQDQQMRELADAAVEGLVVCDGFAIVAANRSLQNLTGRHGADLLAQRLDQLLPVDGLAGRLLEAATGGGAGDALKDRAAEDSSFEGELATASGERIPVETVPRTITFNGRPHRVVAIRDLRARRQAEAEIRFLAYHDPLTGLPNRTSFAARLDQHRLLHQRTGAPFAVLSVDLDRFKMVNDTLGHPIGDALLQQVADRLRSATRGTDVVARLGGDEFSILQTDGVQPEAATTLAARLVELLARPFVIEGNVVNVGGSIGIALAPVDGEEPAQLVKCADLALYRAKLEGRGTFRFFEPEMDARMQERRALELDLRRALALDEFELHYQPQLAVRNDALVGCEALIRWRHPQRGLVPPAEFIPLAEETGLIVAIGEWVLVSACREAARWPATMSIAVNLSPAQFKGARIVETVGSALARAELPAHRLELEITESLLLQNNAANHATLHRLRDLGIRISMDDFGTGYSSLSYLRRFPFDKIKIDRSFIRELTVDPECHAIVVAVLNLGRSLKIATTAEGVETAEQLDRLRHDGCDEIQGYLISRPLRADEVDRLLQERAELAA